MGTSKRGTGCHEQYQKSVNGFLMHLLFDLKAACCPMKSAGVVLADTDRGLDVARQQEERTSGLDVFHNRCHVGRGNYLGRIVPGQNDEKGIAFQ
jgi:hypothetical protein